MASFALESQDFGQSHYQGQSQRTRTIPAPLRLQDSTYRDKRSSGYMPNDAQELLYDVPTSASMSMTPTGRMSTSNGLLTSPTSPTSRGRARRTPPPPGQRSATPQPFNGEEMEEFAAKCHAWYYNQDHGASQAMSQTLASAPPSQRAQYSRIQASIRAAYHASVTARKKAEFQAHLAATAPGGSLTPHARANPFGSLAKKERRARLDNFVRTWCKTGLPGTKPFFQGLWAVMRLQALPQSLGGAGSSRIEWEFDEAVFMESAGKDFMLEAIDVLKGTLGFEDRRSSTRSQSFRLSKSDAMPQIHFRSRSEPLSSPKPPVPPRTKRMTAAEQSYHPKRARAPSDPFVDAHGFQDSQSSSTSRLMQGDNEFVADDPPPSQIDVTDKLMSIPSPVAEQDELQDDGYLRIWTAPDLSNPEYNALLKVFPSFLAQSPLPRFSAPFAKQGLADIEEGLADVPEEVRSEVRFGTGVMWPGSKERSEGWQGSWWDRFKLWWRRLFC